MRNFQSNRNRAATHGWTGFQDYRDMMCTAMFGPAAIEQAKKSARRDLENQGMVLSDAEFGLAWDVALRRVLHGKALVAHPDDLKKAIDLILSGRVKLS